uniref:Uncharacterized protein n=1 Tax=Molossus molossus TaxID=27622 RepID=A0A7J8F8R3_MOLMO|nr:hypothetical protein HJG59_008469 [Molossus molossus]
MIRVYVINNRVLFKENSGHNLFFLSCPVTDSFIQQIRFEHLLLVRNCSRNLGHFRKQSEDRCSHVGLHFSQRTIFSRLLTNNRLKEIAKNKDGKLLPFPTYALCPALVSLNTFLSSTFRSSKQ